MRTTEPMQDNPDRILVHAPRISELPCWLCSLPLFRIFVVGRLAGMFRCWESMDWPIESVLLSPGLKVPVCLCLCVCVVSVPCLCRVVVPVTFHAKESRRVVMYPKEVESIAMSHRVSLTATTRPTKIQHAPPHLIPPPCLLLIKPHNGNE